MADVEISWSLGRPHRGRVSVRNWISGDAQVDAAVRVGIMNELYLLREHLQSTVDWGYPTLTNMHAYVASGRGRALFVGVTIGDPRFFYHEWDTRPHWPPFGKDSALRAWVEAHGMGEREAFFIARAMAPAGATNAVLGGHRMTVSGGGGHESYHTEGRMVATRGDYKLTDALDRAQQELAYEIDTVIDGVLAQMGAG